MKLGKFLCYTIGFCSQFPLFVGHDRAQYTKGIQMYMNN